jgi:hypothetical protein
MEEIQNIAKSLRLRTGQLIFNAVYVYKVMLMMDPDLDELENEQRHLVENTRVADAIFFISDEELVEICRHYARKFL